MGLACSKLAENEEEIDLKTGCKGHRAAKFTESIAHGLMARQAQKCLHLALSLRGEAGMMRTCRAAWRSVMDKVEFCRDRPSPFTGERDSDAADIVRTTAREGELR